MGLQIGKTTIYYYGIIIMLGALAAAWLAAAEARRKGQSSEIVWDGLVWILVGGIIGARIWHILTPPASMVAAGYTTLYYFTHPLDAINIRAGGLGIPGAVLGGLLALYIFARRRKLDFAFWLDVAAPALALGQAIGRWGIFSTRNFMDNPPIFPGRYKSILHTAFLDSKIRRLTIRYSYMNPYGILGLLFYYSG